MFHVFKAFFHLTVKTEFVYRREKFPFNLISNSSMPVSERHTRVHRFTKQTRIDIARLFCLDLSNGKYWISVSCSATEKKKTKKGHNEAILHAC